MSSDEEDVDLNEDTTVQMDNVSDDGTDMMDTEGKSILRTRRIS